MTGAPYKHTQTGWVIICAGLIAALVIVLALWQAGPYWALLATVIFLALFSQFARLTVEIAGDALSIRFGMGLIRKTFSLLDIQSCRAVKNHWYYGWGIRYTPHGWLYNVSGLKAVEIQKKDGKTYRIGTDEPQKLAAAIEQATQARS